VFEYSTISSLVGADGTTVTFNGNSGLLLTDVSGFDSPNIRTNVEDLPETDGAIAGNSYLGQRPITLSGEIIGVDAAVRNQLIVSLQRAARGLRSNATLYGSPSGLVPMQASLRVVNLRVTGQWKKAFQLQAICADPRMYSQALNSSTLTQSGMTGSSGASFPLAFPINFGGGSGASVAVNLTNAGNFSAPATIRIAGPITDPHVTNAATLETLYLDSSGGLTLAAGEYVEIDTLARTVTKSDGTNYYAKVRFPASIWLNVEPGSSTLQLWGSVTSAVTALTVSWRDTWV
jgi:hypothetical protein